MDFVNANIILGVCAITLEETPPYHDFGTFIVTRAFLSRSINCTLYMEEERFHTTVMWFTQNNEKFCNSCKGLTVKAQFVAFFKEITFRLRYALGMRQLLRSIPFLFVRHTQCIMGQWRLYVSLA